MIAAYLDPDPDPFKIELKRPDELARKRDACPVTPSYRWERWSGLGTTIRSVWTH